MSKKVRIVLMSIGGIILAAVLNSFIENLLIPDPCYYHSHKTSSLFDLFYRLAPSEGYHPFPTALNFTLTFVLGILLGLLANRILFRKTKKPNSP